VSSKLGSLVRMSLIVLAATSAGSRNAAAQNFVSAANLSQTIPSPTAAQYDAAAPNNATGQNSTTNFTATLHVPNGGGSNPQYDLKLAYGTNPQGLQLQVQWKLLSFSGGCGNAVVSSSFQDISTSPILTMGKNSANCTVVFAFRVSGLSYAVQQAPGPNGTNNPYVQNVTFSFTLR
jgi:hypothetical protein